MNVANENNQELPTFQDGFGDHVRAYRKTAGLTLTQLSEQSGLSISALSKIENGQMSPTFYNLMRLAEGLGIHIADLVTIAEARGAPEQRMAVTRKEERQFTPAEHYSFAALCGGLDFQRMKPMVTRVSPASDGAEVENVAHDGEEFINVLKGNVEIRSDGWDPIILKEGDCIYFDSTIPHCYVSTGPEDAEVMVIWLPPTYMNLEETKRNIDQISRLRG